MPIHRQASKPFHVSSTGSLIVVATPWMLCAGTDHLRLMRNVQGTTGTCTTYGAYQTASVRTSEPDQWSALSTQRTGDGFDMDDKDLSTVTDKLWVRGGIVAGSSSQSDGEAQVVAMVEGRGQIVASGSQFLYQTNGTYYNEIAVSQPVPLVGMTKAMACFDFEHQGASAYVYPTYRLLASNPEAGGSWSNIATPSQFTSSQTWNSGEQTLADNTSYCWVQFGLKWKITTGSAQTKYTFVAIYG